MNFNEIKQMYLQGDMRGFAKATRKVTVKQLQQYFRDNNLKGLSKIKSDDVVDVIIDLIEGNVEINSPKKNVKKEVEQIKTLIDFEKKYFMLILGSQSNDKEVKKESRRKLFKLTHPDSTPYKHLDLREFLEIASTGKPNYTNWRK